jgi:hypothetical protein
VSHWTDPKVWIGAAIIRHIIPGVIVLGVTVASLFEGQPLFALLSGALGAWLLGLGIVIVRASRR